MERQVTRIIEHMASSHWNMTRIIEANRQIVNHMAQMTTDIPKEDPSFGSIDMLTECTLNVNRIVASYLVGLADLEDAIADNLLMVMKEVVVPNDGE